MHRPLFAVVTAAGMGTRLGDQGLKALVDIAGRPMLAYALDIVIQLPNLGGIAITAPADALDDFRMIADQADSPAPVVVCAGGDTRALSVQAGLAALGQISPVAHTSEAIVLIHDAARCFTPLDQMLRVARAVAAGCDAVTPAIAVTDTITVAGAARTLPGEDGPVAIEEAGHTPPRATLRAVQTPQGFPGDVIWRAHTHPATDVQVTDDVQMVVAHGGFAALVPGCELAFKVTVPSDLDRAKRLVEAR